MGGWSNEKANEIFPGIPGTGGAAGLRAPGGTRLAVSGDELDRREGAVSEREEFTHAVVGI